MKKKNKIILYALNMLIANADEMVEEDLHMSAEKIEKEVEEIKKDFEE
jgi:hypothetical protein